MNAEADAGRRYPIAAEPHAATTAQEAYKQILREYVAPALRELGFRGAPSRGKFRYETGEHAGDVRFQKSYLSTQQEVTFWVLLNAVEVKTEWVYWDFTLADFARDGGDRGDWTIRAGDLIEPVAREVVHSLLRYGWPAIQAALDNPCYWRAPAVQWRRTFPKIPQGPGFDEAAERSREELVESMKRAESDSRALRALLARLESDPDPVIRRAIAWHLLRSANEEDISQALRATAAEDEDFEVRWIARYALRLAGRAKSENS